MIKLSDFISPSTQLFRKNGERILIDEILEKIRSTRNVLIQKDILAVSIGTQNVENFIGLFFGALLANKQIVLLPNYEERTLLDFSDDYCIHLNECPSYRFDEKGEESEDLSLDSKITFFTSGTTGHSSKAIKKLEHLLIEVDTLEKHFSKTIKNDVIASSVSHQHIYGLLFRLLWPLYKNKPIIVENLNYPEEFALADFSSEITLISSPAFLKRLVRSNIDSTSNVTNIFSSGGLLTFEMSSMVQERFNISPLEVFGSTETGGIAARVQLSNNTSWGTFENVSVDKNEEGQLVVKSDFFFESEIVTNDIVEILQENRFTLLGRTNRLVKIEEKRISLDEVEMYIKQLSGVVDVYCSVMFSKSRDVMVCIIEESSSFSILNKKEKVEQVKKHLLSRYESLVIPRIYRFVEKIPYNEQSKISSNQVKELMNERIL